MEKIIKYILIKFLINFNAEFLSLFFMHTFFEPKKSFIKLNSLHFIHKKAPFKKKFSFYIIFLSFYCCKREIFIYNNYYYH
jgi:hypothetical protein